MWLTQLAGESLFTGEEMGGREKRGLERGKGRGEKGRERERETQKQVDLRGVKLRGRVLVGDGN